MLGMALDEPQENDTTFVHGGIMFFIETDLLEIAKPIHIDFIEWLTGPGFNITSSLPASGEGCS